MFSHNRLASHFTLSFFATPLLAGLLLLSASSWAQDTASSDTGGSSVTSLESGLILAVSKPPLAVLESDPVSAVVWLEPDLSTSADLFRAGGEVLSFEYLRLTDTDTAFLSFDVGADADAPGGILAMPRFTEQPDGFDPERDRRISGAATGLDEPKGLAVDSGLGVVVVADFGTNTVKGFDTQASGDVAPLFDITDLGQTAAGEPRQPWAVEVDSAQQRLYVAATDGTVLVYDDYLLERGQGGPDRVIVPTLEGEPVSANLHGILYLSEQDTLVVADFGPAKDSDEPGFDTDGKLFVLENASRADGETEVKAQLAGPNTGLGNPSDLAFDGSALYVGDKVLDAVLRFDDVLSLSGAVDPAPTGALTVIKPESLLMLGETP